MGKAKKSTKPTQTNRPPKKNGSAKGRSNPKTNADIIKALQTTFGKVAVAARILGIDVSALFQRIKKSTILQEALREARASVVPFAEAKLMQNVAAPDQRAIEFTLNLKKKDSGRQLAKLPAPPPKERDDLGRPTKLTPEIEQAILELIRGGNYRKTAALYCGIVPDTLYRWLQREDEPFLSFSRRLIEAETQVEAKTVIEIMNSPDMRDRRWWLERKFPHRWGRTMDVHIKDDGEGAGQLPHFPGMKLLDPKVEQAMDDLENALGLREHRETVDAEIIELPIPTDGGFHDHTTDSAKGPRDQSTGPPGEVS